MPNIGFPELVVILVIVLLLFGPKKLPDFARSMGQAIREFRRASHEMMDDIQRAADEPKKSSHDKKSSYDYAGEVQDTQTAEAERPKAEGDASSTRQL